MEPRSACADPQAATKPPSSAPAQWITLDCQAGAAEQCERVERELHLVGLSTTRSAIDRSRAVVRVNADGSTKTRWLGSSPARSAEAEFATSPGVSKESVALSTAEYLRGELRREASTGAERSPSAHASPTHDSSSSHAESFARPWFLSTGPTFLVDSVTAPSLAWTIGITYLPGHVGLGAFATGTLHATPWAPVEKELHRRQLLAGLSLQLLVHEAVQSRLRLLLAPYLGLRMGWFTGRDKEPEERYHGSVTALSTGAQAELSHMLLPWLSLGGAVGGAAHMNFAWPEADDRLKKKSEEAFDARRGSVDFEGAFFASVLLGFHFR